MRHCDSLRGILFTHAVNAETSDRMEAPVDLSTLEPEQFRDFINSFDTVLTDCDGVLYHVDQAIPGSVETINKIKDLGKKICYVSNNSILTLDKFHKRLNAMGFHADRENIIFPTLSLIDYLKSINFTKEVYLFGVENQKAEFEDAGIKIVDSGSMKVEETFTALQKNMKDNPNIGAVIVDMDVNYSYIKLSRAAFYLRRPDVLFLAGATDKKAPVGLDMNIIGPGYFLECLEDFTGRKATVFGKPSTNLCPFINKKFNITDPKRTLFIGDSLYQDMSFANFCGYQKLFVLTGINTLDQAMVLKNGLRPDYYARSLKNLKELLDQC